MIDIKSAVRSVIDRLESLEAYVPRGDARLEEFDLTDDGRLWVLTFSFDDMYGSERTYRTFTVDEDANVMSMKIWPIQRRAS